LGKWNGVGTRDGKRRGKGMEREEEEKWKEERKRNEEGIGRGE
jgi:hypothetical protein